jgi:hypothetical protein
MPRKIQSSGESTQGRNTSLKRAMGTEKGSTRSRGRNAGGAVDGGKWAGSGRKTVEHSEGPAIARQKQTGRGAKTRTAMRSDKKNHLNHG